MAPGLYYPYQPMITHMDPTLWLLAYLLNPVTSARVSTWVLLGNTLPSFISRLGQQIPKPLRGFLLGNWPVTTHPVTGSTGSDPAGTSLVFVLVVTGAPAGTVMDAGTGKVVRVGCFATIVVVVGLGLEGFTPSPNHSSTLTLAFRLTITCIRIESRCVTALT